MQSVLPLIKKPASSRSPTRSQTSLLVTQCKAVTAPLWPLSMRTLVWSFFCPAADESCFLGVPFSFTAPIRNKQQCCNHRRKWKKGDIMVDKIIVIQVTIAMKKQTWSTIGSPFTNTTKRVCSGWISAKHALDPAPANNRSFCR